MIHSRRGPTGDLTIHEVRGPVTTEDIRKVIEGFHVAHATRNVVWDFRQADAAHLSTIEIQELVDDVKRYAQNRQGGKTALVLADDLWYGQGRIFHAYAELKELPVTVSCFRSMTEAEAWLGVDPAS